MRKDKLQIAVYGLCFLIMSIVSMTTIQAQDRMVFVEEQLDLFRAGHPNIDDKIDISVSDLSINEFLRGVAKSTGINISVDNGLNFKVANSFKDVAVYDLLIFLCRQYNLELKVQGSIIHISASQIDLDNKVKKETKTGVVYVDSLITIDVEEQPLFQICRSITTQTGVNVLPDFDVRNQDVSAYVYCMPLDNAVSDFAKSNNLKAQKERFNVWRLSALNEIQETNKSISKNVNSNIDFSTAGEALVGYVEFDYTDGAKISVSANEAPVAGLIKYVSDSLKINYAFVGEMDESITINMYSQSYDDFIEKLLKGTKYSCKKEKDVYYFVDDLNSDFGVDKHVYLQNRTIESILNSIPENLKEGVAIVEYPELNSLFLSGNKEAVDRLESFIIDIDQVIPVVLIEVLIVDVNKSKGITTGINAGFGDNPEPSKQTIMPGIDYQLSTKQINGIFKKFESFGWVNLGKVNPDFYLAIKALEDNGYIYVRSTPKLSTLNGCKASLSSGETKYYKEEQSNYYGSQNPALSNSYTWKPINADMSVNILPVVSGDDQVTLEIEVQQSEFTPREFEDSPPGSVSRNFKSLIRVKNQEMVLLGGLDRMTTQDTGKGIPLLARIPVIKWFFSSRTKSKSDSRLNVFIQPTILY